MGNVSCIFPNSYVPDAADTIAVVQGNRCEECRTECKRGGGKKLRGGQEECTTSLHSVGIGRRGEVKQSTDLILVQKKP